MATFGFFNMMTTPRPASPSAIMPIKPAARNASGKKRKRGTGLSERDTKRLLQRLEELDIPWEKRKEKGEVPFRRLRAELGFETQQEKQNANARWQNLKKMQFHRYIEYLAKLGVTPCSSTCAKLDEEEARLVKKEEGPFKSINANSKHFMLKRAAYAIKRDGGVFLSGVLSATEVALLETHAKLRQSQVKDEQEYVPINGGFRNINVYPSKDHNSDHQELIMIRKRVCNLLKDLCGEFLKLLCDGSNHGPAQSSSCTPTVKCLYHFKEKMEQTLQVLHSDSVYAENLKALLCLSPTATPTMVVPYGRLTGSPVTAERTNESISEQARRRFSCFVPQQNYPDKTIGLYEALEPNCRQYFAGDLFVFAGDLLHAGGANNRDQERIMMFFGCQADSDRNDEDKQVHVGGLIDALYSDPFTNTDAMKLLGVAQHQLSLKLKDGHYNALLNSVFGDLSEDERNKIKNQLKRIQNKEKRFVGKGAPPQQKLY